MSTPEKKLAVQRVSFHARASKFHSAPEEPALTYTSFSSWIGSYWNKLRRQLLLHQDLLALFCLSLFLNFWGITRGLPNVVDWDPDSVAPLGPLVYAKRLLYGEIWWEEYPPFHFTLLAAVMAPYVGFLWLTGELLSPQDTYPYGLTQPETALSAFILIARSVSALMGVGLVGIAYQLGKELFDRRTGLLTGFLLACCPLSVYYAHTANLEVPYLFWSALAFLAVARLLRTLATQHFVQLGVFMAFAIGTKDQAYGLFVLVPAALLIFFFRYGERKETAALFMRAFYALASFIVAYLFASNIPWNFSGWLHHLSYITGAGSARYQTFANTPSGHLSLLLHTVAHLANALNVPVFLCCLAGLFYIRKNRIASFSLLVPFIFYYLTFLSVILYVYPRFVFPLVFLALPFGGRVLSELWETRNRVAQILVLAVLVHSFAYGFFLDLQFTYDSRYQAEAWMTKHLQAGAVVGTDAQPAYLPRFPKTVKVIAVSFSRGRLSFPEGQQPEYLIFSRAQYRRYRISNLTEPEQKLVALLGGDIGYKVVAAFDNTLDNEPFFTPRFLPYVSPTIIILQRISSENAASSPPSNTGDANNLRQEEE